jgi:capsular polysaccharide biosynthesis protein
MAAEPRQYAYERAAPREDLFSLDTLIGALWKRLWIIVLVTAVATGAAVGFSLQQTPQYTASIKILIGENRAIVESPGEAINLQSLTLTMVEAINSLSVAEGVAKELDSQVRPETVLANMSAEGIEGTQFIQVNYTDTDPERAQRVANTIGSVFSDLIEEAGSGDSPVTITIWERAQLPSAPVSPDPVNNALLGLVLGGILGAAIALLLAYLDDRWQSPEEVEQVAGVPNLGAIPHF